MKTALLALLLFGRSHKHHHGPPELWRNYLMGYLLTHVSPNSECLDGFLAGMSHNPESSDGGVWSPSCDWRLQTKL